VFLDLPQRRARRPNASSTIEIAKTLRFAIPCDALVMALQVSTVYSHFFKLFDAIASSRKNKQSPFTVLISNTFYLSQDLNETVQT
jgi:hypothetical protein